MRLYHVTRTSTNNSAVYRSHVFICITYLCLKADSRSRFFIDAAKKSLALKLKFEISGCKNIEVIYFEECV